MDWKKTLLICLLILFTGVAATVIIFSTEPTASQTGATKETAMLVDVTKAQQGTFRPVIRAMGTVVPSQDVILSPRVSGEIIDRSQNFTPGGFVQKGELLLQIDPSDYENILRQRESELTRALADLKIEMGRQEAARREYQLYGDTLPAESEALVLREPQLQSVKSQVESARAAVEQAELELERTTIEAPFDAHILSRSVNVGSQVAAGEELGRLVGLDSYWIEAAVPLSKLRWLNFSDEGQGSEVRIRNRTAWAEDEYRSGYLYQLVGALADQTRMARVLISVPDPLAHHSENSDLPRLMIGSFVEVHIRAKPIEDVTRLNRDYIRQNDTVWIMEDGELQIQEVDVVFEDAQYAYISSGLTGGDQIVTTNLTTVTDGAPLRLEESETTTEQDTVSVNIE